MAAKGDKAKLYEVAFRMYTADGKSLTDIEAALGVSRQTLSAWKSDSKAPANDLDEWDKAREQRQSVGRRLKNLLERELKFAEEAKPGQLGPATLDGISKLGALVQRFEQSEREAALKGTAQRAALFLDFVRDLIEFFTRQEPGVVGYIEANFDDLIQWGRERYGN